MTPEVNVNGEERDEVGLVLIRYESGSPTCLSNHPALACAVALLGQPTRVRRLATMRFMAEWDLPGRVESRGFGNPWPLDRRAVVALEVCGAAYDAVCNWIGALREEASKAEARARGLVWELNAAAKAVAQKHCMQTPAYRECGDDGCSVCGEPE